MKDTYPSVRLEELCWLLGVSRQAYYKWKRLATVKKGKETLILSQVKQLREEHPELGTRKLHHLLKPFFVCHHIKMGRDGLFSTLAANKLLVRRKRRRASTTQSHHWLRKYPNLVKDWKPSAPEQLWVADITYVPFGRQHFYLSLVTDAFSHKIMGYHLADSLEAGHCRNALQLALGERRYPEQKLIHHSDRGIQYCSTSYTELLKQNSIEISMTQSSDPLDNPIAERINGIIKNEYLRHFHYINLSEAKALVRVVVESYNKRRPHQSIGLHTPNSVHLQRLKINKQWSKKKRKLSIVNQSNHM